MNRAGALEGTQFQIFLAAEAIIAITIGIGMISYVNSLSFGPADVIARDLALTVSTLISTPPSHTVTVNYQVKTSNYRISALEDKVTVQGSQTAGQAPIIQGRKEVEATRVNYKPSFLLETKPEEIKIDGDQSELGDYCEIIRGQANIQTYYMDYSSQTKLEARLQQKLRDSAELSLKSTLGTNPSKGEAVLRLEEHDANSLVVKHHPEAQGTKKRACLLVSYLRADPDVSFDNGISLTRDNSLPYPERMTIVYANESISGVSTNALAESILEGLKP